MNRKNVPCPTCPHKFKTFEEMTTHVRHHHRDDRPVTESSFYNPKSHEQTNPTG